MEPVLSELKSTKYGLSSHYCTQRLPLYLAIKNETIEFN